jgi:hypothetical protein
MTTASLTVAKQTNQRCKNLQKDVTPPELIRRGKIRVYLQRSAAVLSFRTVVSMMMLPFLMVLVIELIAL